MNRVIGAAAALVWLRRDLRLDDNAALYHALRSARQVWCAFVFDREILDPLPRADRRVEFIRDSLVGVDADGIITTSNQVARAMVPRLGEFAASSASRPMFRRASA